MDRQNSPPLALTLDDAGRHQGGSPRARKKLQKSVGLPRTYPHTRRATEVSASHIVGNGKPPKPRVKPAFRKTSSNKPRQAPPRAIPDLSDAKWLEYVRSQSKESLNLPTFMVQNLSYLSIGRPTHQPPSHRPKVKMSTTRRRAKTPVFSIGQLEGLPLRGYTTPARASVDGESISEQYKRLVDECDRHSNCSDAHSEPPPSRLGYREQEYEARRQRSSDSLPSNSLFSTANGKKPLAASPVSDDGTLVSFEEETVYFKPVSFSPEPRSPNHVYGSSPGSNASNPFASPSNLSLQICLDLLTRELSSALSDRRQRPGSDISALQVWVMIEAFERLRDQVAEMGLGVRGVSKVEEMFETWIQALYAVHDLLTGETAWGGGEESV